MDEFYSLVIHTGDPVSGETKLSSSTTVNDYKLMVKQNDRDAIADFLFKRFNERYLIPFSNKSIQHGFSMMAISCLMIEALESFRQGWENSKGNSKLAFKLFFQRSNYFVDLRVVHHEFYKHIRCGLLHQAETTGGWRITRSGIYVIEYENKVINATIFMERLEREIEAYVQELKSSEWNSEIWKNTKSKIKYICQKCNA